MVERAIQPGARGAEVARKCRPGNIHHLCDLGEIKAGERAQFDHACLARVDQLERVQGLIKRKQIDVVVRIGQHRTKKA